MKKLEDLMDILDPPYQTIEELKIGRMLDQYGIPFFYKQPTVILNNRKNEIWKPSFILPQYGCAVIDYIPEEKNLQVRINAYRYNHIPATVLGPKYLNQPYWRQDLYEKIQQQIKFNEYNMDQLMKN